VRFWLNHTAQVRTMEPHRVLAALAAAACLVDVFRTLTRPLLTKEGSGTCTSLVLSEDETATKTALTATTIGEAGADEFRRVVTKQPRNQQWQRQLLLLEQEPTRKGSCSAGTVAHLSLGTPPTPPPPFSPPPFSSSAPLPPQTSRSPLAPPAVAHGCEAGSLAVVSKVASALACTALAFTTAAMPYATATTSAKQTRGADAERGAPARALAVGF
jgi:hypothetical protein